MGKNKLKKFGEMEQMECVFQYPYGVLSREGFPLKGRWNSDYFHNDVPIVLELGCGKGEYTVGLARRFPHKNFIGIDIKGARMWTGAKAATLEGLGNVAFVRTNIELLSHFFAPGEVSEIWITFPDPQMKKVRKRLKTDSPFLYTYTRLLTELNGIVPEVNTDDLYHSGLADDILQIRTYYEQQWLARGLTIKYLAFPLAHAGELQEPTDEIPPDTYRSFSRGVLETDPKFSQQSTE